MSRSSLLSFLLACLLLSCSSTLEARPSSDSHAARSEVTPAVPLVRKASGERVAIIAHSRIDSAVAEHLAALGAPLSTQQMPVRRTLEEFHAVALTLPETVVLWVDSATSAVSALRKSDGTLLTRGLPAEAFVRSPYVAALVASELLELLQQTPMASPNLLPSLTVPSRMEPVGWHGEGPVGPGTTELRG